MSGISIERFMQVARESSSGDIRMRADNEDKLVNKGTVGNRLATVLNMGDAGSRNDRTNIAIDKFRQAMVDRYQRDGLDALNQALEEENPDAEEGDPQRFTGRVVMRAAQLALEKSRVNQTENRRIIEQTTIQHDDPQVEQAFNDRFKQVLEVRTGVFRQSLSENEVSQLKSTVSMQVRGLTWGEGRLAASNEARKALSEALQSVVVSVANKKSPEDLIPKLLEVQRRQDALVEIEDDGHRETGADKTQVQTYDALRKQETAFPGFIADLQRRSLADNSALRAVYTAAKQIFDAEGSSHEQKTQAHALMSQCEALVGTVNTTMRPLLELRTDDLDKFKDGETVDQRQVEMAQRTLAPIFEQWSGETEHCRSFLENERAGFDKLIEHDNGIKTYSWDSPDLCDKLERSVKNHQEEANLSLPEALQGYRAGIERDQTLHPGLKDKMMATLDAMQAEHELIETMKDNRHLAGVPPQEVWRLVVPGNQQDRDGGKWGGEQDVQGSYAGLCRGLTQALRDQQSQQPLTGESLGSLHRTTTQDNFRQEGLRYLYSEETSRNNMDTERERQRVDGSYRQNELTKWLKIGDGFTEDGARELQSYAMENPTWFRDSGETSTEFKLSLQYVVDPEECRQRADEILYKFEQDSAGQRPERQLNLVAGTIQQLHRSQLFKEDDSGSTLTLMTNRLLLSVGLRPTILDDPSKVMGCSRQEFIAQIKAGQEQFGNVRDGMV
jgi:hypothetical protein